MDTNVLDSLLDRIQRQERDKLRLQRKLGRAHWHRNQAQAELVKVRDEKETLTAQRTDLTARLRKATQNEADPEQDAIIAYAKQVLEAAGMADEGNGLVPMVRGIVRNRDFWQSRSHAFENELAAKREQRDRLVADNTALATERDGCRKDKHELEDELRQVRHTLSLEQNLIRELHRDVMLYKLYAKEVWKHSFTAHAAACRKANLDEDWHEVTNLPAQEEVSDD